MAILGLHLNQLPAANSKYCCFKFFAIVELRGKRYNLFEKINKTTMIRKKAQKITTKTFKHPSWPIRTILILKSC